MGGAAARIRRPARRGQPTAHNFQPLFPGALWAGFIVETARCSSAVRCGANAAGIVSSWLGASSMFGSSSRARGPRRRPACRGGEVWHREVRPGNVFSEDDRVEKCKREGKNKSQTASHES
ncbi:hypothetical protein ACCO45_009211 [Purpureocillium lilacinum]|uniref:Uncharacterized protein n=1 Tax=Purpureocillium lilacinum TaxID=33203 RepID=A0ACC4DJ39_PURLI